MSRFVADQVKVVNLALRHLAQTSGVVDMDTDTSEAAEAARAWYPMALDEVLRDFRWPFATSFATLALVAGPTPPATIEYQYSYRYPIDCIKLLRILPGGTSGSMSAPAFPASGVQLPLSRFDTLASRVPYRVTQDTAGLLILTDFAPQAATTNTPALPIVEYTAQVDDATRYPADFASCLSLLLATYMAPTLTGGDRFKLGARAMQLYEMRRAAAQANAMNEQQPDPTSDAELIQARS